MWKDIGLPALDYAEADRLSKFLESEHRNFVDRSGVGLQARG